MLRDAPNTFVRMRSPCVRIALSAKQLGQYGFEQLLSRYIFHQKLDVHAYLASR